MPITVLLADDTDIMRRAIRNLLEDEPAIKLVGEAKDFSEALKLTAKLKPQVIVLDLHMPSGSETVTPAVATTHFRSCGAQILAISVFNDDEATDLAHSFGAATLLDKMQLGQQLIPAVRSLAPASVTSARGNASRLSVHSPTTP
jgi:DNA-binding NarL/FixJ family response regulator